MKIRINSNAHKKEHSHIWYYNRVGEIFEAVKADTEFPRDRGLVRITDKSISGRKFATSDVYDIVVEEYLPSELFETLD